MVSDGQILALVAAAEGLSQRHRQRYPAASTGEADERLRHLDWAVRTGRLVLARRAGTPTGSPPGAVPPGRLP